jgi:hypothetical protein
MEQHLRAETSFRFVRPKLADDRRQVPARAVPGDDQLGCVNPPRTGMAEQPIRKRGAVIQRCGKLGFWRASVIKRYDMAPRLMGNLFANPVMRIQVAQNPTAAVKEQNRRGQFGPLVPADIVAKPHFVIIDLNSVVCDTRQIGAIRAEKLQTGNQRRAGGFGGLSLTGWAPQLG